MRVRVSHPPHWSMKYLGIDYGTKKIGLALSDEEGRVAFPYDIILNDEFAPSFVADLIYKEGVDEVVMGESKNLGGELNEVANGAVKFARKFQAFSNTPVNFEDERFSTAQVRNISPEGAPRGEISKKRRKLTTLASASFENRWVDGRAAAIMLQSFLDKRRANG